MINLIHTIFLGILSQLQNNSMMVAGLSTVTFGALLAICRNVPSKIFHMIKTVSTITLTLNTKNTNYHEVAEFINGIRINVTSRNFSLAKKPYTHPSLLPSDKQRDKENKMSQSVILGYGMSFAMYKGTFIFMTKTQLENKNDIDDQLTLTLLTRNKNVLNNFLNDCFKKEHTNVQIYVSEQDWFLSPIDRSKRSMDSIFINNEIKDEITKSIDNFLKNKEWYINRGIPYKHCITLYGPPGTGKTSLIHALASQLNRNIRYLSSLDSISRLCEEISANLDIVVIEDIDALGELNREDIEGDNPLTNKHDKKVIHNLLNVLDGLKTPEGLIIIITTNHIDKLDEALKRAGRIDKLVKITPLNKETMKKMYLSFYGEEHKDMLDKFLENGYTKERTGADLQQLFLTYDAVDSLTYLE
jgi:chaperone BCS1